MGVYHKIQDKIADFEGELPKLKEATTVLESVLCKMRINDHSLKETFRIKSDEASVQRKCRITCGTDVVIGHVVLYIVTWRGSILPRL